MDMFSHKKIVFDINSHFLLPSRRREACLMNVSLTPELEALVNEKVRSGLYHTASEVVREALRLLKQRDDAARRADQQAGVAAVVPARNALPKPRAGRPRGRR